MAVLFSKDSPYVHSNYYLFSNQMRDYLFSVDEEKGLSKMQSQIRELKKVRDQLKATAQTFLGGDTPEEAWRKIQQNDSALSKIGKQVVADPRAKQALLETGLTKNEATSLIKDETQLANHLTNELTEMIDMKALAEEISEFLFEKGFGKKKKVEQIEELRSLFNIPQAELDKVLDRYLKGKLRSSKGKIQKIVKEILAEQSKSKAQQGSDYVYNNFMAYFKRAVREKAKAGGIYSINDSIVERYLKKVEDQLKGVIKSHYVSTEASRALGEEIIASVNDNKMLIMVAGGEKTENDFRKELLPSLETATTWTDPTRMSYSDMVLINKDGMRVRAQSKNYVGAYEKFLHTDKNVYQNTYLFSKQMLFTEFFDKLQKSGNIAGSIDLDYLSYIVANEIWFDAHGSIDRGSNKGFREGNPHTRLFGSDSWLSRAMSGAFINFLGVVVSEGTVVTDVSNVFFLIDNKALVPTYELINNVLKYWENGLKQITNIHVVANTKGVSYNPSSPEAFLAAKAKAVESEGGLGAAVYENAGLVGVGKAQGASIMSTLMVKSVNLGIDLKELLSSAWVFGV